MLIQYLIFLITLMKTVSISSRTSVGSVLFTRRHINEECWNENDLVKLRAREIFETILPGSVKPDDINKKYIRDILKYLNTALDSVGEGLHPHKQGLLKEALADTFGGYLRSELLPTVRFAYYAGYVPYRQAREAHDFLEEIKLFLNTQGLGWKLPPKIPQWTNMSVVKVLVGTGKKFNPCNCLVTKRDSNSCIHVPTPKLDDDKMPSAIAIPFKTGGLVSLIAPTSESVLLKYYTAASRCILRRSPGSCRHGDFVNFNEDLWHWMKRDVAAHLMDEEMYPAFGGILRVAAAVQSYGKGLSRRNLFQYYQEPTVSKWHPWSALANSYVYIDTDWTPTIYIGIVALIAMAMCSLQICYNYVFGEPDRKQWCKCKGSTKKNTMSSTREIHYANAESSIPIPLPPHQSAVYCSERKRLRSCYRNKACSLGSLRTQRVYDLNENTEKLMAVIMSDNENTETETTYTRDTDYEADEGNQTNVNDSKRSSSPPKIETPIAQLRIQKPVRVPGAVQRPMYSTSTMTLSENMYGKEQQVTDSILTSSSSTARSMTSASSRTKSRRSRRSRDVAWARRVLPKNGIPQPFMPSASATDLDLQSLATPRSRR